MPDIECFTEWSASLAAILEHIDDAGTIDRLADTILRMVPFDRSIGVAYPQGCDALLLFNRPDQQEYSPALSAYLRGTYLLDPFYLACANEILPGLYRMRDLAPDHFFDSEYYHSPAVHPCISMESGSLDEEIGFFVKLPAGFMAVYSLLRSNGSGAFSDDDFAKLRMIEPMVRYVLTAHWRSTHEPSSPAKRAWSIQGEAMDLAFAQFARDALTERQRLIVQLILRGHSNLSISHRLGITEGTAKIHRKGIYDRLKISSQSELFNMFINFLTLPANSA